MKTRNAINVPIIPTRARRIAELNGLPLSETLLLLCKLEKAGKVKSEAATVLEGGGEYWSATETPEDGWNQATVEVPA